jgi:hypothetical protein
LPLKLGLPLNDGFGLALKPAAFSGPVTRSISRRGLASLFGCGRSARGLKGARGALPKRFSPRS